MFKAVVGQAEGTDTERTIDCVISQCRNQLEKLTPTAGIIYSADHFDHELIHEKVYSAFPDIELVGCTTGGEISSAHGFSQDSICLTIFASDSISMTASYTPCSLDDSEINIEGVLSSASARINGKIKGCLIISGPLVPQKAPLLQQVHKALGSDCIIFGGVSGADDFNGTDSLLYHSYGVAEDGLSMLLFAGPIRIESIICNSWEPVGYKSTIDKTEGNSIKRIGGRTALEFFRHAFGPYAQPLPEMPLALFDETGEFHLRSTNDYDESEGSLQTTLAIPQGSTIQLTEATPARLLENLKNNICRMFNGFEKDWTPQTAMLFSCTSRRWILGMRTKEEIVQVQEVLPSHIPISGFYTFGEIAPLSRGGAPKLHNCTMVALVMGETDNTANSFPDHNYVRQCYTTAEKEQLLALKIKRAQESQRRLEMQKESFTNVLRRTSSDLAAANRKIKEHNLIMQESLTMAQEVQQSLIPNYSPLVKGFEIAGKSISCDETGGDYLDYIPDEKGLSVVVGDVSGHGVAAALVMTTARALLRMRADMGGEPEELIFDLNRLLTEDLHSSGRFMTFFYLNLDESDRSLTWVRAGHDPALVYSPDNDKFHELMGEGMALGVLEDFKYSQYQAPPLEPGEIVLINTDGITEAHSPSGELYGRERLKGFIRANADKSAPDLTAAVFNEIKEFQQGLPPKDDETLVVIKASRNHPGNNSTCA